MMKTFYQPVNIGDDLIMCYLSGEDIQEPRPPLGKSFMGWVSEPCRDGLMFVSAAKLCKNIERD